MNRIQLLEAEQASPNTATLYQAVKSKMGLVPNMVKALGHSTAALEGYLGLSAAVSKGTLRPTTREKIALLVAEVNQCEYCVRAHSAVSGMLKISDSEIESARCGKADDPKEQAILDLAKAIVDSRGAVSDESFSEAKYADVTEEEIAEVTANVAVNVFTNYFNRLADTECEFPSVESISCSAS